MQTVDAQRLALPDMISLRKKGVAGKRSQMAGPIATKRASTKRSRIEEPTPSPSLGRKAKHAADTSKGNILPHSSVEIEMRMQSRVRLTPPPPEDFSPCSPQATSPDETHISGLGQQVPESFIVFLAVTPCSLPEIPSRKRKHCTSSPSPLISPRREKHSPHYKRASSLTTRTCCAWTRQHLSPSRSLYEHCCFIESRGYYVNRPFEPSK